MDTQTETKLMLVLEHFLSLHEADEVFNLIVNDGMSETAVTEYLDNLRTQDD